MGNVGCTTPNAAALGGSARPSKRYSRTAEIRNIELTPEDVRDLVGGASQTVDLVQCSGCFSLGSRTDQELSHKRPFGKKAVRKTLVDKLPLGLGFSCRKGLKATEQPNQDSWFVVRVNERYCLYGVADGHGKNGHDVSQFVKEKIPKFIVEDVRFGGAEMEQLMKDAFYKMQALIAMATDMEELDAEGSGTTATIVAHDMEVGKIWVAHVGDSDVCIARRINGQIEAVPLTRDHTPDLKVERERIERAGGQIVFDGCCHRVGAAASISAGMLNMSRSLGDLDLHAHAGVVAEPEISQHVVAAEDRLLLCSDGVWTHMDYCDAVRLVMRYKRSQAMEAAECLARASWDRWQEESVKVDDITVLCIDLDSKSEIS